MASVALEKLVETRAEAGAASLSVRGMRDSSSERGRAKANGCVFASSSAFKGDSME